MDEQVADVYDKILKGNSSGLAALQQIKRTKLSLNPAARQSSQHDESRLLILEQGDTNPNTDHTQQEQQNSDEFRKYLKEKMTKLRSVKQDHLPQFRVRKQDLRNKHSEKNDKLTLPTLPTTIRREVKSTNGKHQPMTEKNIPKQFQSQNISSPAKLPTNNSTASKMHSPVQIQNKISHINNVKQIYKKQEKKNHSIFQKISNIKQSQNKKNALQENQSMHSQQPQKGFMGKGGKSKQFRQNYNKLNEQERKMQMTILQQHKNTQQNIEGIIKKYGLSEKKFKELEALGNQKESLTRLFEQVTKINLKLEQKRQQLKKQQQKTGRSIIKEAIQRNINKIEEQSECEEEQAESVQPLLVEGTRYASVMAETKDKKWLLRKRVQYDVHRATIFAQSHHNLHPNISQIPSSNILPSSKNIQTPLMPTTLLPQRVTVNQRLKNLLLD